MRRSTRIFTRATLACACALLGTATAPAQTILPGSDVLIPSPPPDSLCRGHEESNQHVVLVRERQGLVLPTSVAVDVVHPQTYPGPLPPDHQGDLAAGTAVDCWIFHQDSLSGNSVRLEGSVVFPTEILGILLKKNSLKNTDAIFFLPETSYPGQCSQTDPHRERGLEFGEIDTITLHADLRQIDFEFKTIDWVDEIRVITRAATADVTPYCFGTALCPCGNDDAAGSGGGCLNSTHSGGRLSHGGSPAVVAAPDFSLAMNGLPAMSNGIVFMGSSARPPLPFGNGLLCVQPGPPGDPPGLGFLRFPVRTASPSGTLVEPDVIGLANGSFPPSGIILPGSTWYFQGYYRDPWMVNCQPGYFNLTNALEVSFH